jgi:hypothetical protein
VPGEDIRNLLILLVVMFGYTALLSWLLLRVWCIKCKLITRFFKWISGKKR